jgi:hypothetical protein
MQVNFFLNYLIKRYLVIELAFVICQANVAGGNGGGGNRLVRWIVLRTIENI